MPTQEETQNQAGIRAPRTGEQIQAAPSGRQGNLDQLAKGLGWFSIGLGLAEILAPNRLSRWIGMGDDHPALMPMLGVREISAGIGILRNEQPVNWLWGRVAGDMMDLAVLGSAYTSDRAERDRLTAATAAVVGVTALDIYCAQSMSSGQYLSRYTQPDGAIHVQKSLAINRPVEECYRFWRDFRNLGRFMSHLQEVRVIDDRRSHWVAYGPAGSRVEWEAAIAEDRPNEFIRWYSLEGADVDNRGSVRFEQGPAGKGTLLRASLEYYPPYGAAGAVIARLFGEEPQQQMYDDLRRFKQIIETGEITVSDASPGKMPHAGQPRTPGELEGGRQ